MLTIWASVDIYLKKYTSQFKGLRDIRHPVGPRAYVTVGSGPAAWDLFYRLLIERMYYPLV